MTATPSLPTENIPRTNPKFYQKGPISICRALIEAFSTTNRKRHPSWAVNKNHNENTTAPTLTHVRLITIGPSHFCEKARWALDLTESDPRSPFYYTEDAHPPIFAGIASLEASDNKASMTPMVVYTKSDHNIDSNSESKEEQGKIIIYDSSDIMKHFCSKSLYPPSKKDEIMQMESYFGSHLGATTRVLVYHYLLQHPYYDALSTLATAHSSDIEKFLWRKLLDKGIAQGLRKAMNINEESAKLSLKTVRQVFHEVSEQLQVYDDDLAGNEKNIENVATSKKEQETCSSVTKKKEYLMDTKYQKFGFTAADLTFAALGGIIIDPPELKSFRNLSDDQMPKELIDLKYELRQTLAGQHVLEIYKKHRLGGMHDNKSKRINFCDNKMIIPKVVGRNQVPFGVKLAGGLALSIGAIFKGQNLFSSNL